jgi:hypothetical protein
VHGTPYILTQKTANDGRAAVSGSHDWWAQRPAPPLVFEKYIKDAIFKNRFRRAWHALDAALIFSILRRDAFHFPAYTSLNLDP